MSTLTEILEGFDPIRLARNPTREQFAATQQNSDRSMVRALVRVDPTGQLRDWFIWPGQLSEHIGVIMQTGLTDVIPLRLTGQVGRSGFIEVTDTRADLPTGELSSEWLAGAVQRFVARQKLYSRVEVDVWPINPADRRPH